MSFVTKNNKLILKNGKLLVGDPYCCCGCSESCSYIDSSYGFADTVPPGKGDNECPISDATCSNDGACCGEQISGYIYSPKFSCACINNASTIQAIIQDASFDNLGSLGGIQAEEHGSCPARFDAIYGPKTVTAQVESVDKNCCRAKLDFSVSNDESCGPVGMNASVTWLIS